MNLDMVEALGAGSPSSNHMNLISVLQARSISLDENNLFMKANTNISNRVTGLTFRHIRTYVLYSSV